MISTANVSSTGATTRIAPGPAPHFLLGNLPEFRKDALHFMMKLNREYGGVVRFQLGKKIAHLVSDPAGAKHVLQDNYKNYTKGKPYGRARYVFGEGLITSDGEHWRRQRKLMQPVFHRGELEIFATIMTDAIAQMLERWQTFERDRRPVNIADDLRNLALRISARSLFTTDIDRDAEWLQHAFNQVNLWFSQGSKTGYLVPPSFPLPSNLRMKRTIADIDRLIKRIITLRRRGGKQDGGSRDLLDLLMSAKDADDGSTMSDDELRDEVMTLLFAAHESTGTTIAWTMSLLSKYPEVEDRARAEVSRVLADRVPTFADIPSLEYLKLVIEETMRLYPAGAIIPREVVEDDVIGSYAIPAGSIVFLSPYVMHRDPTCWDNPEAFDPVRFLPANVEKRHRFSYIPFVLGPRQCIGNHFAMTEMVLAIAMILRRFDFQLIPGMEVSTVHLRFDEGMWMTVRGAQ
jgi:cytochrome P450